MPDTLLMTRLAAAAVAALILASAVVTAQAPAAAEPEAPPAHVVRGNDVEASYKAFVTRLARYRTRLLSHLEEYAPDLAEQFAKRPPPKPVEYGYLIVPELRVAEPTAPGAPRSSVYTWPWTSIMLDREQAKLATAEQTLDKVDAMPWAQRRETYEQLTSGYGPLARGQRLVDQHLKHNRFWQASVARDRPRYERQRVLHDAVVERERVLGQLRDDGVTAESKADLEPRVAALASQITAGLPPPAAPGFIEIVENDPRRRVLRVPLYTDIPDPAFVAGAVTAIESAWNVETDGIEYRIELDLRTITPEELYHPDAPPEKGTHIDLTQHVARFPGDGGVLTTGSTRTYAIPGRFVSVGPSPISSGSIAHEFGHILGFTDYYLRGARDLGRAGFAIMEIVPDGLDIMAAPSSGRVRGSHFDALIAAVTAAADP